MYSRYLYFKDKTLKDSKCPIIANAVREIISEERRFPKSGVGNLFEDVSKLVESMTQNFSTC